MGNQHGVVIGVRPEMHRTPKCVREIIEKCWAEDPNQRPTFLEILKELELVDAMIKYDTSVRSKVIVTMNFCIHFLFLLLTTASASIELVYLAKARREGLDLYREGIETGIISKHSRSAYHDPVLISFVFSVPLVMVLASLMFLLVPNKKIRAIRRRGPKFSRRKGIWWRGVRKVCGGALEVVKWDYTHGLRSKMKSQAGNTTPNSAQDYFDESSPLLSNRSPISARQFYRLKKEHSSDDLEAQYYSGAKL